MLTIRYSYGYLRGIFGLGLQISIILILGASQPAHACLPALGSEPSTLEERANKTPILFEGIVKQVRRETLVIEVNQYFKGDGPKVVRLRRFNATSCDDTINKTGGRFLFFAEDKGTQPWEAVYDGAFGSVRSWDEKTQAELRKLKLTEVKPAKTVNDRLRLIRENRFNKGR